MNNTHSAYDQAAKVYESKFTGYREYEKRIVYFADLFENASLILDIGCGPGLNAKIFSSKGLYVHGFDISSEMIKIAVKNCPEGIFTTSSVEQYDTNLRFDGICLSFIIVHLQDNEVVDLIKKIIRYVKLNGKVYISFMTGKKPGYEKTSFSENKIYFNYFDREAIISLLNNNDFTLIHSDAAPYQEENGDITEDAFLIFEYHGNIK